MALALSACGGERDDGATTAPTSGPSGGSGITGGGSGDGDGDGDGEGSAGSDGGSGGSDGGGSDGGGTMSSGGDGDGDGDGGIRFDIGDPGGTSGSGGADGGGCDPASDPECGCDSVDLLFVLDNSTSMGDYQRALGLAFPQFADAIIESLPPGTSLHVGVTSTEMGFSSSGSTSNCTSNGNGQPMEAFYVTPDVMNSGRNGAQGRLYDPGGGVTYYELDTDAPDAEVQALKTWFTAAANIGEGGSNIEMATAAAGWAGDPINDPTNAGFIRDQGAVLVVFFMQDEPDQTPLDIGGQPGGMAMLNKLVARKPGCGGANCIIGGGLINQPCLPQTPIGDFLNNLGAPPVTGQLPDGGIAAANPQQAADEMNRLLRDTLAGVIAQKCEEIPPVG